MYSNIDTGNRGVIIYTAQKLQASPVDKPALTCRESCWVEVPLKDNDTLLVGCIYRSPNSNNETNEELLSSLTAASNSPGYSHILICGDFNCPTIDWTTDITPANENSLGFKLKECIRDSYFTQHVKDFTHRRGSQQPATLDLVLTNEEGMVDTVNIEAPLGKSHHATLVFNLKTYTQELTKTQTRVLYNKGDYDKLRTAIEGYRWDQDFLSLNCNSMWNLFTTRLNSHVNECIPTKKFGGGNNRPIWMTSDALNKVKNKAKAYRRYLTSLSNDDYNKYSRARNQARWECRKAKKQFELKLSKEAKKNPKAFYRYVNSKIKTRSGVANLETQNGLATTDKEKAETLNNFFTSVFTNGTTDIQVKNSEVSFHPSITKIK